MNRITCALILGFILPEFATAKSPGTENATALAAIGEGYLSNRQSFPVISCEFVFSKGKAASIEDAIAGKITKRIDSQGVWKVLNNNVFFSLECDKTILDPAIANIEAQIAARKRSPNKKEGEEDSFGIPCTDVFYLSNENGYSMKFSRIASSVN